MRLEFASYVRKPTARVPEGYRLHRYRPGEEGDWIQLLNESREFGVWNTGKLRSMILDSLIPNSGVFISDSKALIACAACCSVSSFLPYATANYALVLPEHRGRGLGLIAMAAVIDSARDAGFPGVVLQTDDFRIPAVKTHLKLGFRPDITIRPATATRWSAVLAATGNLGKEGMV